MGGAIVLVLAARMPFAFAMMALEQLVNVALDFLALRNVSN